MRWDTTSCRRGGSLLLNSINLVIIANIPLYYILQQERKKERWRERPLNLNEFLSAGESAPAPGTSFVYSQKSSWAEEAPETEGDCEYW